MAEQKLLIGNSLDVLRTLPSESTDVCVTSPPYWALRDYGTEPVIWGGGHDCEHQWEEHREPQRGGTSDSQNVGQNKCTKCGAWRGQLGLEPKSDEYIEHLCSIFDEVYRVLKPSGQCWVNIGDTFGKDKSLCMIPYRFAIAMCGRGWILRNVITWHKPNVMPQSCKDRFTVDFEPFFFFVKRPDYYFRQIKEPLNAKSIERQRYGFKSDKFNQNHGIDTDEMGERFQNPDGRNARTTWTIPTSGSKLSHVAMFPSALIDRPIRSCCPEGGTVLDPFVGSGTTMQYCRDHNINCIGIDISPSSTDIVNERIGCRSRVLDDWFRSSFTGALRIIYYNSDKREIVCTNIFTQPVYNDTSRLVHTSNGARVQCTVPYEYHFISLFRDCITMSMR